MIEEDLDLEERIRAAIDRRIVPDRALRGLPTRSLAARLLLGLAVVPLAVLAVGLGTLLNSYRADVAASTPDPQLAPLPSAITRDDAIATLRRLDMIGRVDRIDAKLMSFDEYIRVAGPVRTHSGDPSATPVTGFSFLGDGTHHYVWVVAVSGDVWPSRRMPIQFGVPPLVSPTPYPPYRWGLFLIDADSGGLMVVGDAGVGETWPVVFSGLPSHPVGPSR